MKAPFTGTDEGEWSTASSSIHMRAAVGNPRPAAQWLFPWKWKKLSLGPFFS